MKVVVAIRTSSSSQARQFLAEQDCDIHKSRFETQEPALRNLIDGLYRQGLDIELQGASLTWFLIEADLTPKQWLEQSSVAICFSFDWFQQQTAQIRYLKGIAYCDAAASWAKLLPINDRAACDVQTEGTFDWQGLENWQVLGQTAISPKVDVLTELAPDTLNANDSLSLEGSLNVEDSPSAEGSPNAEGSPSVEDSFVAEAALAVEGFLSVKDSLPAEGSSATEEKPKKNSTRKIITKIFKATKNITQVRSKADVPVAPVTADSSLVKSGAATDPAPIATVELDQPVVKKRGRPRKNPVPTIDLPCAPIAADEIIASADTKLEVSVKPMFAIEENAPVAPKKRGRPRKVVATVVPELDEEQLDLFVS